MPRFVAWFLVILALLPITIVPAKSVASTVDRVELPHRIQHGDVFGLAEAPRVEATQAPSRRFVLARLLSLPVAPPRVALAVSPLRPRFDAVRRRRPECRARTGPADPAH